MPYFVKYQLDSVSLTIDPIPDATEFNAGVMTPAQVMKLNSLTPGGAGVTAVRYVFTGAEGNDFMVTIPATAMPYEISPGVVSAIVNGVETFVDVKTPDGGGDRSSTSFRCIVSAPLEAGSQLSFLIAPTT